MPPWHHVTFTPPEKSSSAVVLLKCQLPQRDPCFRVKKKCTECNSSGHLSYCCHQPQYDASLYGKIFTAWLRLQQSLTQYHVEPQF